MHSSNHLFHSKFLDRGVDLSFYNDTSHRATYTHLILVNDGQDLHQMGLHEALRGQSEISVHNTLVVGCAAAPGEMRKQEYGVQWASDYAGRGSKAGHYSQFISAELMPWIAQQFPLSGQVQCAIAGWSLGGLSAIDIAWHAPHLFHKTGVFSGSLWWRNPDLIQDDPHHRLMHHKVRHAPVKPALKFWFQAGTEDETADRNNNGIIDAIDDTLDLIEVLHAKGYHKNRDMHFHIEKGGSHDVETWSRVMPLFLNWMVVN